MKRSEVCGCVWVCVCACVCGVRSRLFSDFTFCEPHAGLYPAGVFFRHDQQIITKLSPCTCQTVGASYLHSSLNPGAESVLLCTEDLHVPSEKSCYVDLRDIDTHVIAIVRIKAMPTVSSSMNQASNTFIPGARMQCGTPMYA